MWNVNSSSSVYCDLPIASIDSQIFDKCVELQDSAAVQKARENVTGYDGCIALGQALSRQFRYREAIAAYDEALALRPDDPAALRLRAGRYLSTLQTELAAAEFKRCLTLGADAVDCNYRRGLAYYYGGNDAAALACFEHCMPLCDDEMGIAIIYWHTLCAKRRGMEPSLLKLYRPGMDIGHHTAYEKAMRVWAGFGDLAQALCETEEEQDDMEYAIVMYGLAYHPLMFDDDREKALTKILQRDGFWPCFAYLAAWNDRRKNDNTCN